MIFNVPGHIDMIRNGLHHVVLRQHDLKLIIKTQTRRLNRGIYKVGNDYAVQSKRGMKAEQDIRIVMDRIWKENGLGISEGICVSDPGDRYISEADACAEGGYTPTEFEEVFRELNPKRNWERWVFEFHVIEV